MANLKLPKNLEAVSLISKNQGNRFKAELDLIAECSYKIVDSDDNSIWGYVAIDNIKRGPGLGVYAWFPTSALMRFRDWQE